MADYVTPMHPPLPVVEEERIYIGSELAHFVSFFNYYHFFETGALLVLDSLLSALEGHSPTFSRTELSTDRAAEAGEMK